MTRTVRLTTLRAAQTAAQSGDTATAVRLFASLGISYVPSLAN